MKTKKTTVTRMISLTVLGVLMAPALVHAHEVSNAKIIELTLHRVERLVILKKAEATFQTKLKSLKLVALPHQNETDPSFKVTAFQYAGADGTQKSLEIVLDQEGKALSFSAKPGADAVNAPDFGDKDAVALAEASMHWLEDSGTSRPELAVYGQKLTQLTITAGGPLALIDLQAGATDPVLQVRIKLDGSFDSADILPKLE
jgi:hypothetical protein